jgi:hypothetical protein
MKTLRTHLTLIPYLGSEEAARVARTAEPPPGLASA